MNLELLGTFVNISSYYFIKFGKVVFIVVFIKKIMWLMAIEK